MISRDGSPRADRARRLLGSLAASLAINAAFFAVYPSLAIRARDVRSQTAVVSVLHLERRPPTPRPTVRPTPRPTAPPTPPPVARATPLPKPRPIVARAKPPHLVRDPHILERRDISGSPSMSFEHHDGVKLSMPPKYATQDLGNGAAQDVSKYVDFSKAKGAFVPQVWVVHLNASYLSGPTLQDAVHDIVASLAPDGAKISASKPQRVCHGKLEAWFLAYSQPDQYLPGDYENVLFMQGSTVYRVMYSRPMGQPEDPQTRAAMNAMCPK